MYKVLTNINMNNKLGPILLWIVLLKPMILLTQKGSIYLSISSVCLSISVLGPVEIYISPWVQEQNYCKQWFRKIIQVQFFFFTCLQCISKSGIILLFTILNSTDCHFCTLVQASLFKKLHWFCIRCFDKSALRKMKVLGWATVCFFFLVVLCSLLPLAVMVTAVAGAVLV